MNKILKNIFSSREFLLLLVIMILLITIGSNTKYFFTLSNFSGLLADISINSIIICGMTVLLISGTFDMSIGTLLPTISVLFGLLVEHKVPIIGAILISILAGSAIGFIIGIIITKLNINAFITTLAFLFIFEAASWLIGLTSKIAMTEFSPTFKDFPEYFTRIAGGKLFGIEYINFYALAIIIIFYFLLRKNVFFRQNFFIGGNENAAKLAGIKVNIVRIFNHMIMSGLVAVAALLKVSRIGTASAQSGGKQLTLMVIAAAFVGGAVLKGGKGSIIGSFFGIIIIAILQNAMAILNMNPVYTQMILGFLLLLAIIIDETINMYRTKKR